ncbi:MAG: TRAP transporter small permease [Paracoccus sp. (in: a-proteobacteria)]
MNRLLETGRSGLDRLASLYEAICIALLVAMLAMNALNIFSRGVLDAPLNWVWPWTMVAFMYWVMLAFFPLYQRRRDVSIYILLQYLSPNAQRVLGVLVSVAIIVASGLLIQTFPGRVASMRGTIEMVGLPRMVLAWPLLASAVPICLGAIIDALRIVTGAGYVPFGTIEITEAPE